jgi:mannosyltransferase OCH1-like enzyme
MAEYGRAERNALPGLFTPPVICFRWFREIIDKRICRGTFFNVPALIDIIKNYIDNHNQNPQVVVWTAPVAQILFKVTKKYKENTTTAVTDKIVAQLAEMVRGK